MRTLYAQNGPVRLSIPIAGCLRAMDRMLINAEVSGTLQRAGEMDQRIARWLRWPRLDLTAAYGVSDRQIGVGRVLGTYTQGINAGLSLSVPLFDGGRLGTRVEQARLRAQNAQLAEQQARLQVERDVRNAFTTWNSQREMLRASGGLLGALGVGDVVR